MISIFIYALVYLIRAPLKYFPSKEDCHMRINRRKGFEEKDKDKTVLTLVSWVTDLVFMLR